MKKEYSNPIIEIVNFDEKDIITTSGNGLFAQNNLYGYGSDEEFFN